MYPRIISHLMDIHHRRKITHKPSLKPYALHRRLATEYLVPNQSGKSAQGISVLEDVGHMKKGWNYGVFLCAILLMIATVSAGTVVSNYQGSNVCKNGKADTFIGFENGVDLTPITTQYSGVVFSPVAPAENWMYGDVINGAWNYPAYWCNGNVWASLEGAESVGGAAGRIDFPNGANYVSVLVSGYPNVVMEAYDASGILIDSAGPTSYNLDTSTMDQLTVEHNGIRYVLIHDTGQYWVIDDLCTDAAGDHPISTPEFPSAFLPVTFIVGILGAVLLIQRTREQ